MLLLIKARCHHNSEIESAAVTALGFDAMLSLMLLAVGALALTPLLIRILYRAGYNHNLDW